jgi:hypothetical protein
MFGRNPRFMKGNYYLRFIAGNQNSIWLKHLHLLHYRILGTSGGLNQFFDDESDRDKQDDPMPLW